jgi:hypothetical protein
MTLAQPMTPKMMLSQPTTPKTMLAQPTLNPTLAQPTLAQLTLKPTLAQPTLKTDACSTDACPTDSKTDTSQTDACSTDSRSVSLSVSLSLSCCLSLCVSPLSHSCSLSLSLSVCLSLSVSLCLAAAVNDNEFPIVWTWCTQRNQCAICMYVMCVGEVLIARGSCVGLVPCVGLILGVYGKLERCTVPTIARKRGIFMIYIYIAGMPSFLCPVSFLTTLALVVARFWQSSSSLLIKLYHGGLLKEYIARSSFV